MTSKQRLQEIMKQYCEPMKNTFKKKYVEIPMPAYSYGDTVRFTFSHEEKIGVIEIVDKYGTFEQNEEPSYDILIEEENMLYKHIRQSEVLGKESL